MSFYYFIARVIKNSIKNNKSQRVLAIVEEKL